MKAATENDLKRLEDLIINGQRALENRLTTIETRLTTLETGQAEIKGDLKTLGEKVDGIDRRLVSIEAKLTAWEPSITKTADLAEKVGELKNWRSIAFLILGAIAGWIARNSMINNP
jgi:predicted  nucleic acid-binding Zn-ribbon protein